MKKTFLLSMLMLSIVFATAQDVTLTELQNFCKLLNWQTADDIITKKGWEFHDSKRGDTYEYSTITYAYDKKTWHEDRAAAWLYFFTYNNRVEKVGYTPTDKAYKTIKASLAANGYKQLNNEINDGSIVSTYSNSNFYVKIETETQERMYGGGTMVNYFILLTRKGGIYDDDNGEKVVYYPGTSTVKQRYTLKDGKIQGKSYEYDENGKLDNIFTWVNGKRNGVYEYYHKNGKISVSGTCVDDEMQGLIVTFDEQGNKRKECYYKGGEKNGKYVNYVYDDDGNLFLQRIGNYVDDEKDGLWEERVLVEGKWKTVLYSNYRNGVLNGAAKEYDGDSIIDYENASIVFCSYNNGNLDGKYLVMTGRFPMPFINPLFQEEEDMITLVEGFYANGKKEGEWKIYVDCMKPEIREMDFENRIIIDTAFIFGHQLMTVKNYHNDKLQGKYTEYKDKILAPFNDSIDFICYYNNGEKHGRFERHDNDGNIIEEGQYSNGKKNGQWRYFSDNFSCVLSYKNGCLNGKQLISYLNGGKLKESEFDMDCIKRTQHYDTKGNCVFEFNLIDKRTDNSFYATECNYRAGGSSKIDYYYEPCDGVLDDVYFVKFDNLKKEKHGKYLIFDEQKRKIIEGKYNWDYKVGKWTYYFYDQNLYYVQDKDDMTSPLLFYTITGQPYSGLFTREETIENQTLNAVYTIKKSLIEKIVYSDPTTGKTVLKEKYKKGVKQ